MGSFTEPDRAWPSWLKQLHALCSARDASLRQISVDAGLGEVTLIQVFRRASANIETLQALARLFDVEFVIDRVGIRVIKKARKT